MIFSGGKATDHFIKREFLFDKSKELFVRMSYDGSYVSYIEEIDGINYIHILDAESNIFFKSIKLHNATANIIYTWTYKKNTILFLSDQSNSENWGLYKLDIITEKIEKVYHKENVQVRFISASPNRPHEILIGINEKNKLYHDIYILDLLNNQVQLYYQSNSYIGFVFDLDYNIKLLSKINKHNYETYFIDDDSEPKLIRSVPIESIISNHIVSYDFKNNNITVISDENCDTNKLININLISCEEKLICPELSGEIKTVSINPITNNVDGIMYEYIRKEWIYFDNDFKHHMEKIKKYHDANINILSRSINDDRWLIQISSDKIPESYFVYSKISKSLSLVVKKCSLIPSDMLSSMNTAKIKSRDGLDLICYYTLPKRKVNHDGMSPMIVLIHGGPWIRDSWDFNTRHQWLSDRGYFVLSVNFRGSSGLGKVFLERGKMEWGRKIHEDIVDATKWAISNFEICKNKIGIMGGSYGGYEALMGISLSPDIFRCAVSINGFTDLNALFKYMPLHMRKHMQLYLQFFGANAFSGNDKELSDRSPVNNTQKLSNMNSILVINSKKDVRSNYDEAVNYVNKMHSMNQECYGIFFKSEGHTITSKVNKLLMYGIIEEFLSSKLGGVFESIESYSDDLELILSQN